MTGNKHERHRSILRDIARKVMREKGLLDSYSPEILAELDDIHGAARDTDGVTRDMRDFLWSSIDNDESRDLDQITVALSLPGGFVKIFVAIADVDALVKKFSAIDEHARQNTTSIYTVAEIFPMLPEKLSTNFTSLSLREDRLAVVVEMMLDENGALHGSDIYRATVCNKAKLAYDSVADWLDGSGTMPPDIKAVEGLDENLRLQDRMAQKLKIMRRIDGALDLETSESTVIFDGDTLSDVVLEKKNRAKDIIESFMLLVNSVVPPYLTARKFPMLRRVVRTPKRWDRIVAIANDRGVTLPSEPDSKALDEFLLMQKRIDPLRFPDLSLSVIKLMGAGEYVADFPGSGAIGHFGLAVKNYTHSTAPNRRYPDLIVQRLLKSAIEGAPSPYGNEELEALAKHCTEEERASKKVERMVKKSAAALVLEPRIGEQFDALVTGASDKGTWVRLFYPSVEGRLEHGFEGVDVGDKIRVQLLRVNVARGYIDFKRVGAHR